MSDPKSVVVHQVARGKHTYCLATPAKGYIVQGTYLATLAGMHAVMETGGLVPADATQHRSAIEFWKKRWEIQDK